MSESAETENNQNKKIDLKKLELNLKEQGADHITIKYNGEICIYNVEDLKNNLIELFNNYPKLEMDISKVKKIDTAGFQLLLAAKIESERRNVSMEMTGTPKEVNDIFDLYGETIN